MTRLPVVDFKTMDRLLRKLGFELVRQKGSHVFYRDPPEGFSRWYLRLLADRVVELDYIDSVSHETVRRILKKTNSSPGGAEAG